MTHLRKCPDCGWQGLGIAGDACPACGRADHPINPVDALVDLGVIDDERAAAWRRHLGRPVHPEPRSVDCSCFPLLPGDPPGFRDDPDCVDFVNELLS